MIELALTLGWRLSDLDALEDVELATIVDVLGNRRA